MRQAEELDQLAGRLAAEIASAADHNKAQEVALAATRALNGNLHATGMLAAAFLLRGLMQDCPDDAGFLAVIIRLVAATSVQGEPVH